MPQRGREPDDARRRTCDRSKTWYRNWYWSERI
jgi:hypothetical protein